LRLDNLRSGGTLRWKVEDRRLGRSESEMWKVGTSNVIAPPVSAKDWWVSPVRKYWMYRSHTGDMDRVSLVASCQHKLIFSPLLYWMLWERNWVQTHGLVSRRAVGCVGSPSSWEQWICSNLLTTTWKITMRWSREIRMVLVHTQTERGMCVACWSSFPYRVYIDSNSRDSRICVTACLRPSACS
jgi:hypothetical protein